MAWTDDRIDGAFEGLRTEMRDMRAELRTEMRDMRVELRDEFRSEIGGVRGEIGGLRGEIGGVRGEIGGVRGEIGAWQRPQSMIGWGIAAALLAQLLAFVITQS